MTIKRHKSFARLPLALAIFSTLYGSHLLAQTPPATAQEDDTREDQAEVQAEEQNEARPQQLERITVTGSLITRQGFDTISPVQVISADVSTTMGQLDTASILQTSNVAAGSTQINNQFSGFVVEGGQGVQTLNFRGLGANRTLVLLDGRRPGPAGTRGQVGAFDLNVIPTVILQRVEILKDGGGSVYGSDALAGVANLITRRNIDRPELVVDTNLPMESGGERFNIAGATGFNFQNGSIVAAAQYFEQRPLKFDDRDFFRCANELVRDANGAIIPYEDRSVTRGTPLEGCLNFGIFNAVDDLGLPAANRRYVQSPDGVFNGPIPGYRLGRVVAANPAAGTPAFYEHQFAAPFLGERHVINANNRFSFFSAADFTFDDISWNGQFLYTKRETSTRGFRQFFPVVDGRPFGFRGNARPLMPFRSNSDITVDYIYLASGFTGDFGDDSSWTWRFDTTYSRSDGDYTVLSIARDRTGDLVSSPDRDGGPAPINYFTPGILSGADMDALQAAVGELHTGNTVYTQLVANATMSGNLFELPAGTAAAAFGTEFRRLSINDTPSQLERSGGLWGQSAATGTEGTDYVTEAFGELEVPLLAGLPLVEELALNASARVFKYDTVPDSDNVWKIGMGWQVIPSVRLRATNGTSYRAPGLYELFLGDQTAFLGQTAIDPCIRWGESIDPTIRTNCAASGIPQDYDGTGQSATIVTGGGAGVLVPETSRSFTAGIVWTPEFINLSASIDYFEIEVNDQIGQLGGASIVGSCYSLPTFPNNFCDLFERNSATAANPFNINEVRDSYININRQKTSGFDLNVAWEGDFAFGKFDAEAQFTYTTEQTFLLFDTAEAGGFATDDVLGTISNPELVGNLRTSLNRGDWTYTWFVRYVDETSARFFNNGNPVAPYRGTPVGVRDIVAEARTYHGLSVRYAGADWSTVVGVNNVFNEEPPTVSAGTATRFGNIPAFATQYDWFGRELFVRFSYEF